VLGAFVLTILPWQIWSALWAHPSRMLTYPLGYTIRHPDRLGDEVDKAFRLFREAGLGHAISVRWDSIVATVWPFDPARNFVTLPDVHLSSAEAWFTVHDRTIGGMVLFALIPALVIGFVVWHRRATYEWVWALVAPLVLAVGFWGIEPQGLGAALLQPTAAVLVALAAGGLVTGPYALSVVVGLVGILEAASVVWLGLFARSASSTGLDVAIAVAIWSVPAIALAIVLLSAPRSRARETRARPRATFRPAREPAR
jgi:hypothetical protein